VDLALVPLGTKSVDSVLAIIMFAFTGLAAATVFYLLGRHQHRQRKARKRSRRRELVRRRRAAPVRSI
jgi:hypothetical protein